MIIYCKPFTFQLKQIIYAIDNNSTNQIYNSTIDTLSDDMAKAAKAYNAERIVLEGNYDFCAMFKDQIESIANNNYGLKNIEVEIIEL